MNEGKTFSSFHFPNHEPMNTHIQLYSYRSYSNLILTSFTSPCLVSCPFLSTHFEFMAFSQSKGKGSWTSE